jgi:anti-sigma B factor antagonist
LITDILSWQKIQINRQLIRIVALNIYIFTCKMHPYSIAQVKMLEIGHTISQGVIIVTPTGWLDTASYEEFLKYCTALPAGPVILDLSNLTYISSAGLRALRQFEKGRRDQGTMVVIAGSKGFVHSVIRMSGFDQLFLMYPSTANAIQVIGKPDSQH